VCNARRAFADRTPPASLTPSHLPTLEYADRLAVASDLREHRHMSSRALLFGFLSLAACKNDAAPPVDMAAPPDLAPSWADKVTAATWTALSNGPHVSGGQKQDDLYPLSATTAFAVSGPASTVYKTVDGGMTWTTAFQNTGTYFRSVLFTDDLHGFVSNLGPLAMSPITDTNVMYETKDAGSTWNPVTAITGTMPTGICNQTKIDAQHLIAVGRVTGPSYLLSSSDGGASWTSHDLNTQLAMLIDAHFTTPMDGIVVGGSAGMPMVCTILHTSDGGQSWSTVFTSQVADSLCWKISFPSEKIGYVSVQETDTGPPTFAKTTDGGMTWTELPLPGTDFYKAIGIGFITDDIGWVSSEDGSQPTYRTLDGGMTWTEDAALMSPINRFRFVDHQVAYAIGGKVWKLNVDWPTP
jgi:photosystem II stability/assembly factor-like uncharacterized protein